MKTLLLTILSLPFAVSVYIAILFGLTHITLFVHNISSAALQIFAGCGALAAGSMLLLGGTILTTRLAVWIFQPSK
jgi:ABC-type sulfate transport system permease subunit